MSGLYILGYTATAILFQTMINFALFHFLIFTPQAQGSQKDFLCVLRSTMKKAKNVEKMIDTTYTANMKSMMQNRYRAAFWTMRKNASRSKAQKHQ
uniref:Uncharacterized protein n=1 Tax=Oryza meridionalis TaxID=40149 RepID=A0A0E0DTS2_9ORYZ